MSRLPKAVIEDNEVVECGPFVCPFPQAGRRGERWVCPRCGTRYRMTGPKPERWWRNWYALSGHWVLTLRQPFVGGDEHGQ